MLRQIIPPQDLGFVSRVVIYKMDFVFLRLGQQQFTISANAATLGLTSQEVAFQDGFSLISQSGEQLTARKAEWLHSKKLLFIPQDYTLKDEQGVNFGTRAFFTVDLSGKIAKAEDFTVRGKDSTTE